MKTLKLILGMVMVLAAGKVSADVTLVFHYYNSSINDHFYTTNYSEIGSGAYGWSYVDANNWISDSSSGGSGGSKSTLYRYLNVNRHFYTTNYSRLGSGSGGWNLDSIPSIGYTWNSSGYYNNALGVSVSAYYRFIHNYTGTFFYDTSYTPPSGWTHDNGSYSDVDGYVLPSPVGGTPSSSTTTVTDIEN